MSAPAISRRWIERRQGHWARLDALLTACGRRGVRALGVRDLQELALLYRQTASDLATVRGDPASAALARRLNGLMARAHSLLYARDGSGWRGLVHFYTDVFPRTFRETWTATAGAALLLVAGGLAGAVTTASDPGFARLLVGGAMLDTIERGEMWTQSILAVKPLASSGIMTNNLSVALTAFALGATAGLGTVYMMLFNGLLLGTVAVLCAQGGMGVALWSFVAPHGALELPAIAIAGGAGLLLARGIVVPGRLPRRDAFALSAGLAIRLVLGVIPMLVVAGVIEGFVSPTGLDPSWKFLFGAALAVLLAVYLSRGYRSDGVTPGFDP